MKLFEFKNLLDSSPESTMSFILPCGRAVPADFHVTEVGHVAKRFIDCGGTLHSSEACVLQVWVARNDREHRLNAGRLSSILGLAKSLFANDEIEVEVEYEDASVSQYPIGFLGAGTGELTFKLAHKHTDCLAREACGLESGCC